MEPLITYLTDEDQVDGNADQNPFVNARSRLAPAISTLPQDYLDGNAAALLMVIEELKKSLLVEFRVIQALKSLDLSEPSQEMRELVSSVAHDLEYYSESRLFDTERTHCHNIDRIVRQLLAPLRLPVARDERRIREVMDILEPLRIADNDFLDELEPVIQEVVARAQVINRHVQESVEDPGQLHEARLELEDFRKSIAPRVERLKDLLSQMSELANHLLARL